MKYQVIFFFFCGIVISSKLKGNVCHYYGQYEYCCANNENINGICTKCRIGTTTDARGRCVSCKNNMYGYKCLEKCVCDQFQWCDQEVGCVPKTSIPTIHTSYTGTIGPVLLPTDKATAKEATGIRNGTIEPVSPPNDRATAKEANVIRNGTSNTEWLIYTLCITGCFVITVLCYLFRTYRKRHALDLRIVNEKVLKPLERTSYNDNIYDEVDENPLTFVTMGSNVTSKASNNETINLFLMIDNLIQQVMNTMELDILICISE